MEEWSWLNVKCRNFEAAVGGAIQKSKTHVEVAPPPNTTVDQFCQMLATDKKNIQVKMF